ncbi:hypothetical protein [Novipirellula artificiosorum]|uniref:Heparinase II/III-like protein n=1 Tax=Novipirellula artificiosorum TaxID=2528016 RepID=A0A5C6D261_9BACT|nr:hypothetical protein [Novipirellula artificiosorum]TWU31022.1 hypothetical protein Poly41_64910 [Novipirellula artificiosorum]
MSTDTTPTPIAEVASSPVNERGCEPKSSRPELSPAESNSDGAAVDRDRMKPDALSASQWKRLRSKVNANVQKNPAKRVFGKSAIGGNVYRWGVAAASGEPVNPLRTALSQLACDQKPKRRKSTRPMDFVQPAKEMIDQLGPCPVDRLTCHDAVLWAAAMPALSKQLDTAMWWDLLGSLQQYRESMLQLGRDSDPVQLIGTAELGLTLAWRLSDLPSCQRLQKSSLESFRRWCQAEQESVPAALARATDARLVLGSVIRCGCLIENTTKRKFTKAAKAIGGEIATWVAAMTTTEGSTALSRLKKKQVVDDLNDYGLLMRSVVFDPETLRPAMEAALGIRHTGGRLAWEVSLPESFLHCEKAKLAMMLPEWDVRRGRTHLQYAQRENRLEIFAGRSLVVSGRVETSIEADGQSQSPDGDWAFVCEYTDDDVHYIEIEQPWTAGLVLQRQLMLVREDRCLLFADAVLPKKVLPKNSGPQDQASTQINYTARLPLCEAIRVEPNEGTREIFLSDRKRRAIVFPLSASEWNVGPTPAAICESPDGHLVISAQGEGALYTPVWFDFQSRRFRRDRTWRQLTIADERRICEPREAVGYRVQMGSEQWLVYRSLGPRRCRSVLGKHLIADFFAARFEMSDGNYDELVTVDDSELMDD